MPAGNVSNRDRYCCELRPYKKAAILDCQFVFCLVGCVFLLLEAIAH
jgi:hypothetical protein